MKEVTKVYREFKQVLKDLSENIKADKESWKEQQRSRFTSDSWKMAYKLQNERVQFRHSHIARCEMRGRTREEIEKPAEDNLPNEALIEKIKAEWKVKIDEAICLDEKRLTDNSASSPVRTCSSGISA
jgi:hypothetical protein